VSRALVLEREAPEPSLVAVVSIDQVDAADVAVTVEHVVIIVPQCPDIREVLARRKIRVGADIAGRCRM
jgi:hypothetical protein